MRISSTNGTNFGSKIGALPAEGGAGSWTGFCYVAARVDVEDGLSSTRPRNGSESRETPVKLSEIQKPYDLFVSLGSACDPAAFLRVHGLRRFSMPLDWVVSNHLSSVSRLFESRFAGYMELESMRLTDGSANHYDEDAVPQAGAGARPSCFVEDKRYGILSVHDFEILPDLPWHATYAAFRQKTDRRIERLLQQLAASSSVLFVRWAGLTDDAIALREVLSDVTEGTADLLVLQPEADVSSVVDRELEVDGVCCVRVPNAPADGAVWNEVLGAMSLL